MSFPQLGGCECAKIRYQLASDPVTVYACHCTDCQTATGASYALSMYVARDAIKLLRGEPQLREYDHPRWTETARVYMCRMRCVALERKSQSSRAAESPARNPRRHVMVPPGWPHLDTKRAALGHDPARFSSVRKAGGRLTRSRSSLEISSERAQSLGARLIGPPALGALLALLGQLLELLFLRRELGLIFLSGALLVLTLRHGSSIPRVAIPSTQSDSSGRGTAGSNRRVVPWVREATRG